MINEFVYEYREDTYAVERVVCIAEDVTPYIAVLCISLDVRKTIQRLQQVESLQKSVLFQHPTRARGRSIGSCYAAQEVCVRQQVEVV